MISADPGRFLQEYGDGTPGCVYAVVAGGEVLASGAGGMADLERKAPLTSRTRFNLGSASKQFTALAILLLEDQGRLSLDDAVGVHLPEFHDPAGAVTLRHLLHHTSGLRDTYPGLLVLGGWRFTDHITHDDCLRLIFSQRELSFPPGSEHAYANANYVLLAEVAARAAGAPFGEFCRERIFEPCGMADTLVLGDSARLVPGRSLGYYEDGGTWWNLPLTDEVLGPTNVYSTAEDMARWMIALLGGEPGGPRVAARMSESGRLADGSPVGYAAGLVVGALHRGRRVVEHGGQHGGYCSQMTLFPDEGLGVLLLFNHFLWDFALRALQLADAFLDTTGGPQPPPLPAGGVEADTGRLGELAGLYHDPVRRVVRRVPLVDGVLTYQGLPLVPAGGDTFVFPDEPGSAVRFDAAGLTLTTTAGTYRYERVTPWAPAPGDLAPLAGTYVSPELEVVWRLSADDGALRAHRHKHPDTRLAPLFPGAFADDWSPVVGFPMEFLLEFDRSPAGDVTGFRVSGSQVRGLRFLRTG